MNQADKFIKPPREITEDEYVDMLNMLPPVDWIKRPHRCTFKFQEHTAGDITAIFAYINCRYFRLEDDCNLTHDEIIDKVLIVFPELTA